MRWRFVGEIAGSGSSSGIRVVVGRWTESPFGAFADVMLEQPDGHRVLLVADGPAADFVADNYRFDEVCITDVEEHVRAGRWRVRAGELRLDLVVGGRPLLGWSLRLVPRQVASAPWFAALVDPLAAQLLAGVRTRGRSRTGARQWYAARDLRRIVALSGSWRGADLGVLAPVVPPVRFGFASAPERPALTSVTTSLEPPGAR